MESIPFCYVCLTAVTGFLFNFVMNLNFYTYECIGIKRQYH